MSQERLAHLIGVTFQQIQKYEKGVNRVSVGTLLAIASALDVEVNGLLPRHTRGATDVSTLDEPNLGELSIVFTQLNSAGQALLLRQAKVLATEKRLLK